MSDFSSNDRIDLRMLSEQPVADAWDVPQEPVDWDAIEAEARRQGCTVADILYDRAGHDRDAL